MMSNHILIDGWNVCWKIPELAALIPAELEQVRSRFYQMVSTYFSAKKVHFNIVYDGQPMIHPPAGFREKRVTFSSNPEKADDLIIKLLKKQKNKKNWTIVTSDNRLSSQAKDLGANILSSEEFIHRLNRKKSRKTENNRKSDPHVDQDEISYWLDVFSNDDETSG